MTPPASIAAFIQFWRDSTLTERSGSQSHFNQLCRLLEIPEPAMADPQGEWFTFEKGVKKTGGGQGWADVWRKGCFAWEYKGKHKDLANAYITWLTSPQGQAFFEQAGFIPAISPKGQELIEKLGVKDVA